MQKKGFPGGSGGKESACNAGDLGSEPLETGLTTHSSMVAWWLHWQRSMVGYSSWGHKESDTSEQITQQQ